MVEGREDGSGKRMSVLDDIHDDHGNKSEDMPLSPLHAGLLTQALDGRPWRYIKTVTGPRLAIGLENTTFWSDVSIQETEWRLLENNLEAFKYRIVAPIIENLEGCAFPERGQRFMDAVEKTARLLRPGA